MDDVHTACSPDALAWALMRDLGDARAALAYAERFAKRDITPAIYEAAADIIRGRLARQGTAP